MVIYSLSHALFGRKKQYGQIKFVKMGTKILFPQGSPLGVARAVGGQWTHRKFYRFFKVKIYNVYSKILELIEINSCQTGGRTWMPDQLWRSIETHGADRSRLRAS
jgi:hypothetical protein